MMLIFADIYRNCCIISSRRSVLFYGWSGGALGRASYLRFVSCGFDLLLCSGVRQAT